MEHSDYERLIRIRDYCREIADTVKRYGESYETYSQDLDYQKSLAFSILQIGELAGHLSEEFRKETSSSIQWSPIKGMRNIVAHGYGSIDHKTLWDTAVIDIPSLKVFCDKKISEQTQA